MRVTKTVTESDVAWSAPCRGVESGECGSLEEGLFRPWSAEEKNVSVPGTSVIKKQPQFFQPHSFGLSLTLEHHEGILGGLSPSLSSAFPTLVPSRPEETC